MRRILFAIVAILFYQSPCFADFGDADFPLAMFEGGPKSYHDAWCGKIGNNCRVIFSGDSMQIQGSGGITRGQYLEYRFESDGGEYYNYISYMSSQGVRRESLFLFAHIDAQREFIRAFSRWRHQDSLPIPNYRYPNSQGPQDTQGKDKGLNPYSR